MFSGLQVLMRAKEQIVDPESAEGVVADTSAAQVRRQLPGGRPHRKKRLEKRSDHEKDHGTRNTPK